MFCPHCGNQFASQPNFCSACGARMPRNPAIPGDGPLVRLLQPRMIAGVCSGFALRYGWDIALVRILFVIITCLTTGCGILFYLAAWIIIPEASPYAAAPVSPMAGKTA